MSWSEPKPVQCIRCKDIFYTKCNTAKYCLECGKIARLEKSRIRNRRWAKKHGWKRGTGKVIVICKECGKEKLHQAYGMCHNCYNRWNYLDVKLRNMGEKEKHDYLVKRGLIKDDNKKLWTADEIKKDLTKLKGVRNEI